MSTKNSRITVMVVLAAVAALFAPLSIQGWQRMTSVDAEQMLNVSVSIRTSSQVTTDRVGDSVWEPGQGSGFVISSEACEVWTNHHVVEGAAIIEVFPRGWKSRKGIPAQVVASTPRADFAILRMAECDGLPAAFLGDSSAVRVGDVALAVGNPLGLNPDTVTQGIISHVERYIAGATGYLQTDAAINPGNSGGALFNADGKVIGISTAIASVKGVNAGIGYAVPINLIKRQAARLRQVSPSFGDAGINDIMTDLTLEQAQMMRVPSGSRAVMIVKEPGEGPAAGLLHSHDVIYRIGGVSVRDAAHVKGIIADHDAGRVVDFDLIRQGEPTTIQVKLSEGWTRTEAPRPEPYEGLLGMTLEMWSEHTDDRGRFVTPVITRVQSLGPAHRARIMSSQKTLVIGHGTVLPHLLDVKTVTGVVVGGIFAPVEDVAGVEAAARDAHKRGEPLMLEVALWARENPMDRDSTLEYAGTRYFTIEPRASEGPGGSDDADSLPMAALSETLL